MSPDALRIWLNHFEYHAEHPRCIPQALADVLKPEERRLIASSIATFQLGEQSEGSTLVRAARRFAAENRLPALVRIIELFICEEQRHAALLRGFMEDHQIPLKPRDWTDQVFRRLRRLAGLELCVSVLITAELIGNVYYRALESATGCQRLKVLCRTLVADELVHVAFESLLLLELRAARSQWMRTLTRAAHRTFFVITAGVVWVTHRSLLRHAGHGARSFVRACLTQYAFYLEPVTATLASIPAPSGAVGPRRRGLPLQPAQLRRLSCGRLSCAACAPASGSRARSIGRSHCRRARAVHAPPDGSARAGSAARKEQAPQTGSGCRA